MNEPAGPVDDGSEQRFWQIPLAHRREAQWQTRRANPRSRHCAVLPEPPAEQTLGFVLSNSCLCRYEFVHGGLSGRDVLNALP